MTVDLTTMRTVATTYGAIGALSWLAWLARPLTDTAVTIIAGSIVAVAAGQVVRSTVGAKADAAARHVRGA